jgi:5-methyltetrahydropteroyltriglutamate--homocysteine methyltransferase
MQRSTDRILTTHAGSLPRPDTLTPLVMDAANGNQADQDAVNDRVRQAVADVVARQRQIGIDVVSDGEMGKVGFTNYLAQRYPSFRQRVGMAQTTPIDVMEVPELFTTLFADETAFERVAAPVIDAPLTSGDREGMDREISDLLSALDGGSPDQAFISSITPGQLVWYYPNRHYDSFEEYLNAAAALLRAEYQAIIDAGLNLQLDSPEAAMASHFQVPDASGKLGDPVERLEASTDALNRALDGLPPERIRLHVCWGNYAGPHHRDVELPVIIGPILRTRAGFISIESANPRHEHEWNLWQRVTLPDDKALIPGVIDTNSNRVEHPELVAQRIERFAELVGKERVIAGTDCGFETFLGLSACAPGVAWLKLAALVEGARISSERLW